MKKIVKKVLMSVMWVWFILFMLVKDDYSLPLLIFSMSMIFCIWFVDVNNVQKLSINWQTKQIDINRMWKETKKTHDEVMVTASRFDDTIKAFLEFNLADLQKEGRDFSHIKWKDAATFVEKAVELNVILGNSDDETALLIMQSKIKVVELFELDAQNLLRQVSESDDCISDYISSGVSLGEKGLIYQPEMVVVDFEGLRNIKVKSDKENILFWKQELSQFEKYYNRFFTKKN